MNQSRYICPLCHSPGEQFYSEQFQKCNECESIFRIPNFWITSEKEKARYQEHNNNIQDRRYQDFVSPIVKQVLKNHVTKELWLDFWAGTGPVISHLLEQQWYILKLYDPFFHPNVHCLGNNYNYIVSCEVIEHFHKPYEEFQRLYNLLKPGWVLYIMTHLYTENINFKNLFEKIKYLIFI